MLLCLEKQAQIQFKLPIDHGDTNGIEHCTLKCPIKRARMVGPADRDYQMEEVIPLYSKYHIHVLNELKAKILSGTDILGIWDSNLPIFNLPQVNVLPDLIHQCSANYDPCQRAVLSPSGSVLFHITPEAINQMLHFHTTKPLTPLSMMHLIDQGGKLSSAQIIKINQLFIEPGSQTVRTPLIGNVYFNELGRFLVDMISYVLGYRSTKDADETILAMMPIFSPGKTPSVHYYYAAHIANKIHE